MQAMSMRVLIAFMVFAIVSCNKTPSPSSNDAPGPTGSSKIARKVEGYPMGIIKAQQDYEKELLTPKHSGIGFQGVVKLTRTWDSTKPITVAFQGGSQELRTQIVRTIQPWRDHANLTLDFGSADTFREWKPTDTAYSADIRIAFEGGATGGYWSLVGRDSINPSLVKPNEASMNFEGFTDSLPEDADAVILQEFGHALGFDHEHQSPKSNCDKEFHWDDDPGYVKKADSYGQLVPDSPNGPNPGIYTRLEGPVNNWSREQIDFNLRELPFTTDLYVTTLDTKSIMMYHFEPWMLVGGESSSCYTN